MGNIIVMDDHYKPRPHRKQEFLKKTYFMRPKFYPWELITRYSLLITQNS